MDRVKKTLFHSQFRSPHVRRRRRHHTHKVGSKINTINWRQNMIVTLIAVVGLFAVCQLSHKLDSATVSVDQD